MSITDLQKTENLVSEAHNAATAQLAGPEDYPYACLARPGLMRIKQINRLWRFSFALFVLFVFHPHASHARDSKALGRMHHES